MVDTPDVICRAARESTDNITVNGEAGHVGRCDVCGAVHWIGHAGQCGKG